MPVFEFKFDVALFEGAAELPAAGVPVPLLLEVPLVCAMAAPPAMPIAPMATAVSLRRGLMVISEGWVAFATFASVPSRGNSDALDRSVDCARAMRMIRIKTQNGSQGHADRHFYISAIAEVVTEVDVQVILGAAQVNTVAST